MTARSVRETITPETAAEMLKKNVDNRPVSKAHVSRLACAMKRAEWDFNGSTIKVSVGGRLLDGQHRLLACVESGCSFDTLVVYGLPNECFATIDQASRSRKVSDVLAIDYGASMRNVTAALSVLYQFKEQGGIENYNTKVMAGFTVEAAREMLIRHPRLIDCVSHSQNARVWRNAYCACLYYLFYTVDATLGQEFIDVMRNGSSDVKRPFNLFREGLIRMRIASAQPDTQAAAARAIKAFNAEISGRSVSVLVWKVNEEFPRISGLDYESI